MILLSHKAIGMKRLMLLSVTLPLFALAAFIFLYSLDAGCFVCLYGDDSGSLVERWINIGLAAVIVAIAAFALLRGSTSRRVD